MERKEFTLDYFGKNVACIKNSNIYMLQISYVPLYVERIEDSSGAVRWIEKSQGRETQLANEIGKLLEEQCFVG